MSLGRAANSTLRHAGVGGSGRGIPHRGTPQQLSGTCPRTQCCFAELAAQEASWERRSGRLCQLWADEKSAGAWLLGRPSAAPGCWQGLGGRAQAGTPDSGGLEPEGGPCLSPAAPGLCVGRA